MRLASTCILALMAALAQGCGKEDEPAQCEPKSCASLGFECGAQIDNCGEPRNCGECDEGYACEEAVCVCLPQTCESLGNECGVHEGCYGDLDCGACRWPLSCEAGRCVEPDEPPDVLEGLLLVPDLSTDEIHSPIPGARAFILELLQPEDHGDHEGAWFPHRLLLVHRDIDAPIVLNTLGYGFGIFPGGIEDAGWYLSEVAELLHANQLLVEHRFYGDSIAEEPSWVHLNIEQSAGDSSRIVSALSAVYRGEWIGTGVSKGGMTAMFHQRFFPEELAAIVPYVSPISFGMNDSRYVDYLAGVGPADGACRERVLDMALELVERRAEAAEYVRHTVPEAETMDAEVLEALVAYGALSWHWGFWQRFGSTQACSALPPRGEHIEYLVYWIHGHPEAVLRDLGSYDPSLAPYYHQAQSELGRQAMDYSHLLPELYEVDFEVLDFSQDPPPWGEDPDFDPAPMLAVDEFLRQEASRVLAIYGEWDPWTGGMIEVDQSGDNLVIVGPGLNHSASIEQLPPDRREEALHRLLEWSGVPDIGGFSIGALAPSPERLRRREMLRAVNEAERQAVARIIAGEVARSAARGETSP